MAANKLKFKKSYFHYTIAIAFIWIIHASKYSDREGPMYTENLNFFNNSINYSKFHRIVLSKSNNEPYGDIFIKDTNMKSCYEMDQ